MLLHLIPFDNPQKQPNNGNTRPNDKPGIGHTKWPGDGQAREPDVKMMRRVMEKLWEVDLPPNVRREMMQHPPECSIYGGGTLASGVFVYVLWRFVTARRSEDRSG